MIKQLQSYLTEFDYKEFIVSIFWAVLIAVIFRTFLFEPFKIPSGSMIPTLQVGDYLFVSKYSYGFSKYSFPFGLGPFNGRIMHSEPERGDIIVFKGVKDPQTFYIKRLIGLPGDKIQMKYGLLHINGTPVERTLIGEMSRKGHFGETRTYDAYKETLPNGLTYSTLDGNVNYHLSFPDMTDEYTVPEAHYFFMGDNRNNSIDSRFLNDIGFVPADRLLGKARFLLMSDDFSILDFITHFNTGRAFSVIR